MQGATRIAAFSPWCIGEVRFQHNVAAPKYNLSPLIFSYGLAPPFRRVRRFDLYHNCPLYFNGWQMPISHNLTRIRAIDKKPLPEWYQQVPGGEALCLDLSERNACVRACEGAVEVYNLAADMGAMGFIERFRVECLRSILITANLIEAAYQAGVQRYFFSSSACAYNTELQKEPKARALKESDAYPAMAERGYGWEKLMSEMFCQEYCAERGMKTFIARLHNVYGPCGTWEGGREKAPAATCRKVIEAKDSGKPEIVIWGDGTATRSFMYIDDCVRGIDMITHCDDLIGTPINLGSSELLSINNLVSLVEEIAGVRLQRRYDLEAPRGVAGRNSDNTMIKRILNWEPRTPVQ
jgi:GDP-D-mannose 3',5'-epimerase